MKLTVLGTSAAYATAGRSCAGYLVEDSAGTILLDCGSGALSNLFAHADPLELDGIVISHLHFDHLLDVYPLYIYYRFNAPENFVAKPLWVPPGGREHVLSLVDEDDVARFERYMHFEEIVDGAGAAIGGMTLTFRRVPHMADAYAMRITGRATLVYSSDCEYSEALLRLATGADALLCEATFADRESGSGTGHFTAAEVGRLAAEAGVGSVVATHFWPTTDRDEAARRIKQGFAGPVHIAEEHLTLDVEGKSDKQD